MKPAMVILAGPNGAGKSTLYDIQIAPKFKGPFINADVIQRDELNDPSPEAAYRASKIAAQRRQDHLTRRTSFVTETVFSHSSKLQLVRDAKAQGFTVILFHIGVDQADLSVARVKAREAEGGHPVPEDKIREQYDRTGPLIREAIRLCQLGFVFDNSGLNTPPERLIVFKDSHVAFVAPRLPQWALSLYERDLKI